MIEIAVPTLGESVTEATVGRWLKQAGEAVAGGEVLVELETDKVAVEVPAPSAGVLSEILAQEGETLEVGGLLARLDESRQAAPAPKPAAKAEAKVAAEAPPAAKPAPAPAPPVVTPARAVPLSPAVRKLVAEHSLDPVRIPASGRDGRLLKEDVLAFLERSKPAAAAQPRAATPAAPRAEAPAAPMRAPGARPEAAREEVVRMTRLRQRIAERLKQAQQTAAILTTFNEADMTAIQAARAGYREPFEKKHGVRLGFMSFFVRASVLALKELPAVNAEIEGDSLIYKNYYNIGVAVGTPQGLVVPVLKDADRMGFAEIESAIADFGRRARDGKLAIDEMQGGTFTISNGGVYGSLLSTPILNPPQSAILGMHKIQERPMAVDGRIEIRPMMYLALSYDHRVIDGREAVSFLVRVKELLEAPDRLLFDV
jgi:2-oxoglutarate dehydrogenase E2 component (dihydrolipoamide succinyltransferase)